MRKSVLTVMFLWRDATSADVDVDADDVERYNLPRQLATPSSRIAA